MENVDLSQTDTMQIPTLYRTTGEAYELGPPYQEWSWRKMLNSLRDDLLQKIVGPEGITAVLCMPLPDSYDIKRVYAARKTGKHFDGGIRPPIWDFVLRRGDGAFVRLHPNLTKRTFEYQVADHPEGTYPTERMQTEKDVPNCELRQHETTVVVATQGAGAPVATTYHVKVPVLVNTVRLEVDTKVILEWALPRKKEKQTRPGAIWSDRVAQMERKRAKTRDNGSTS